VAGFVIIIIIVWVAAVVEGYFAVEVVHGGATLAKRRTSLQFSHLSS